MQNKLEAHELSTIFPEASPEDYGSIRKNIRQHGFDGNQPIVLLDGKILDGRTRYKAARDEKIPEDEIPTRRFKGGDPLEFIFTHNLARRHMTPSQKAAAAAKLVETMKEFEKAEKEAAKAKNKKVKRPKGEKVIKAAKMTGASPRAVAAAKKLQEQDPEKFAEVAAGKKSVRKATKELESKKSAEEKKTALFTNATLAIDRVYGEGSTLKLAEHLQSKDILKLSEIEKDELLRIKPMLFSGWKLKEALSYKSTTLSFKHNLQALCDAAVASGLPEFVLHLGDYTITVKKS
jgi:hypothetical protein